MRTLSTAATQSLADEDTGEVWLVLLSLSHPDLGEPLRVVNNTEDIVSGGHTFYALPFDLELPDDGPEPGVARLRIDNVSREIVTLVRSIVAPPTVTIDVVLADQPDTSELTITHLTLREVRYSAAHVMGTLYFEDVATEAVAELITPARFPGLFTLLMALPFVSALAHGFA